MIGCVGSLRALRGADREVAVKGVDLEEREGGGEGGVVNSLPRGGREGGREGGGSHLPASIDEEADPEDSTGCGASARDHVAG